MLHIYKVQAKFSLDPNLSRTLSSVYVCSVRMQANQVASVKVVVTLAYRAGLYVILDTVLQETYIPLRGIELQSTGRGYNKPVSLHPISH